MPFDLDDDELKATRILNGVDKVRDRCKYCGGIIEQPKRGKRREYCKKPECIRKMKNEIHRKWYAKRMEVLKGVKSRVVEQKDGKKIIYSSTDKAIRNVEKEDFSDVIELARELGAIRFKIVEAINKCSPEQSKYDKQDQIFLHSIENEMKKDIVYEEDMLKLIKDYINNRPDRRIVKDKQEMLRHLIQGVISNPNQYVVQYIKNRDKRQYNPNKEGLVRTSKEIKKKKAKLNIKKR